MQSSRPVLLALVTVTSGLACHPAVDEPGVPLYPNAATTRPRSQVAQVSGPIASIDRRDLRDQGGPFDLLPGCHIVELDRRVTGAPYSVSGGTYLSGQFPPTIYAIRMKAGARYFIRRSLDFNSTGQGSMILSAREEEANGATTDLVPARSMADLEACQDE